MRDNEELFKNILVGTRKSMVTLRKRAALVTHYSDLECKREQLHVTNKTNKTNK